MAGLSNQIAQAIANQAKAVAGIRWALPQPPDALPGTPCAIVGPPSGRLDQPGSWERLYWTYPLRVYVATTNDTAHTQADTNDLLDLFLIGFRTGIGLTGLVAQSVITSWQTDRFYTIGAEEYQCIDFVVTVELERSATYTA